MIQSLISCSASTTMVDVKSVPLLLPEPDGQFAHATLEEKRLADWSNFFDWLRCIVRDIRDNFNARDVEIAGSFASAAAAFYKPREEEKDLAQTLLELETTLMESNWRCNDIDIFVKGAKNEVTQDDIRNVYGSCSFVRKIEGSENYMCHFKEDSQQLKIIDPGLEIRTQEYYDIIRETLGAEKFPDTRWFKTAWNKATDSERTELYETNSEDLTSCKIYIDKATLRHNERNVYIPSFFKEGESFTLNIIAYADWKDHEEIWQKFDMHILAGSFRMDDDSRWALKYTDDVLRSEATTRGAFKLYVLSHLISKESFETFVDTLKENQRAYTKIPNNWSEWWTLMSQRVMSRCEVCHRRYIFAFLKVMFRARKYKELREALQNSGKHSENDSEKLSCCVCLETNICGKEAIVMHEDLDSKCPCVCCFACAGQILKHRSTCPLCRKSVRGRFLTKLEMRLGKRSRYADDDPKAVYIASRAKTSYELMETYGKMLKNEDDELARWESLFDETTELKKRIDLASKDNPNLFSDLKSYI